MAGLCCILSKKILRAEDVLICIRLPLLIKCLSTLLHFGSSRKTLAFSQTGASPVPFGAALMAFNLPNMEPAGGKSRRG